MIDRFPIRSGFLAIVAAMLVAGGAVADPAAYDRQYVVDLGIGGQYKPKYPGADDYIFVPFPIAKVSRLYLPGIGQLGGGEKTGLSFFPSFNFNGKREASDSPILTGTDTVDWALELGAGVAYQHDWLRGYVEARQGFNGHHGQVVDFGVDVTLRPSDRVTLTVGPKATWGSKDYMSTYFGVSQSEASAPGSVLSPYSPGAGFESVGVQAKVEYEVTERTTVHFRAGWQRLVDGAADSPIVALGDRDQFSVGVGLSREFAFDLFN